MEEEDDVKLFCGTCPDSHCGTMLYFISNISTDVECTNCGQRHAAGSLLNVKETNSSSAAFGNLLKSMLLNHSATRKGTELVKVRGLSNYHCKLVSPLLTHYGMDKNSGKAKLLSELGQPDVFDCSVLGNRAFLIEKEHLEIDGYGKDKTGSLNYLRATLELIDEANEYKSCLVPLHSDGDGHCLVHAISKAVVGRELLWHSLRENLRNHLEAENKKYQALFRDFIGNDEWRDIIDEADPNFHPGTNEPFGLRNMHVFGLANVLHRPIILLDSVEGMQSSGDYSGIFLPALLPPDKCKSQGVLNKPLVIAWSSSARNHYVPLVGIKSYPLPKIPRVLLPKAWGLPNQLVSTYIDFDENGCCVIGGARNLPESYVERLVAAMDEVFFEKFQVCPQLVADVNQFIYKPTNAMGTSLSQVTEFTQQAVECRKLYRCLSCQAVKETEEEIPRFWREPGGKFYEMAKAVINGLEDGAVFSFSDNMHCVYDASEDILKPILNQKCDLCRGVLRLVSADGTVKYMNGDPTLTHSNSTKGCSCGFKHFWDGKEYDNLPKSIPVSLEWNGKKIEDQVYWFESQSDPNLNSNAYEIAYSLVQKHFPGEFGSEILVKKVVDKILRETAVKRSEDEAPPSLDEEPVDQEMPLVPDYADKTSPPSKVILTGPKMKTLHKEELNKSDTERLTKARTEHHAAYSQKRKNVGESAKKATANLKEGRQKIPKAPEKLKKTQVCGTAVPPNAAPRTVTSGATPSHDLKVRLSTSNGRQATVTLTPAATYEDLQKAVVAKLGIAKDRQKLRYGFPPRELKLPGNPDEGLPLAHGDRVSVEELPEKMEHEELESPPDNLPPLENMETAPESNATPLQNSTSSGEGFDDVNREQLASELMDLIRGALNVDRWDTMQNQPELFARGGYIYQKVVRELGPLHDDQHCSVAELPQKTFAYNAKEDRLELCLGGTHIPVQPLDQATLTRAKTRTESPNSVSSFANVVSGDKPQKLGTFSGAVRHRDPSQGRSAFSGKGRTLGGNERPGDEGQNKGTRVQMLEETTGKEMIGDDAFKMDVVSGGDRMRRENHVEETPMAEPSADDNPGNHEGMNEQNQGGREVTIMETGVGETQQSKSTDVEMKLSTDEETKSSSKNVLHAVTHVTESNEHGMRNVPRETISAVGETRDVDHEVSSFKDQVSSVDKMSFVSHALSNGPQEETNIHVTTKVPTSLSSNVVQGVLPVDEKNPPSELRNVVVTKDVPLVKIAEGVPGDEKHFEGIARDASKEKEHIPRISSEVLENDALADKISEKISKDDKGSLGIASNMDHDDLKRIEGLKPTDDEENTGMAGSSSKGQEYTKAIIGDTSKGEEHKEDITGDLSKDDGGTWTGRGDPGSR